MENRKPDRADQIFQFFPSYFLTDVPSNWVLTKIAPRWWLSFLMFSWGAVLTGMAFTNSWQVAAFCRFLLGAFEGGVLPGVTFTIACWSVGTPFELVVQQITDELTRYTKQELHKRIACAYGLGLVSSAFAGILSYGLGQMSGLRGMAGWRWIFSVGTHRQQHGKVGKTDRIADRRGRHNAPRHHRRIHPSILPRQSQVDLRLLARAF